MPRRPTRSAGKSPFVDPATTYISTKLTLPEVAELHVGQRFCSLSTLDRRREEESWDAQRERFWRAVTAEVEKHLGQSQAEREAKQMQAVQSTATVLSALGGLIGMELAQIGPMIQNRSIRPESGSRLLRTLSTAARSVAHGHVALIAAERTLMSGGDAAARELYRAFGEAHDSYVAQRDKAVAALEAASDAEEEPLAVDPAVNGDLKHEGGNAS